MSSSAERRPAPVVDIPLDQEPAEWPRRRIGRGSVPYDWPTWEAYRARQPA